MPVSADRGYHIVVALVAAPIFVGCSAWIPSRAGLVA